MGWALLAFAVGAPLGRYLENGFVADLTSGAKGIRVWVDPGFNVFNFVFPLFLFLLAKVFRRGAHLEEEAEGVV